MDKLRLSDVHLESVSDHCQKDYDELHGYFLSWVYNKRNEIEHFEAQGHYNLSLSLH